MSRSSRPPRIAVLGLLAGLAIPAAAHASGAPTRAYAFGPSGDAVPATTLIGVKQDASEVLFNSNEDPTSLDVRLLARNVLTNETTVVLPATDHAEAASADLQLVLYQTTKALSAVDTNGTGDLYLLNRRTGASTLVSHEPRANRAIGDIETPTRSVISGDGQTVFFATNPGSVAPQVLRFNAITRSVSIVGPGTLPRNLRLGTTGGAVVTSAGIVAGGRTLPLPPFTQSYGRDRRQFRVSDDGRTVADQNTAPTTATTLAITDTVTGVRRTVPLASELSGGNYQTVSVANDGASVKIGASVTNPDQTVTGFIGHVNTATGAVTHVGPTLPWGAANPQTVVTRDEAFAALGSISALGAGPIPGATPPVPTNPFDYVKFYPGCSLGTLFQAALRPSVALGAAAVGPDLKTPVQASVLITNDDQSPPVTFTLAAGSRHSLAKTTGGFTITATVSFSDGSTAKGSNRIGSYTRSATTPTR